MDRREFIDLLVATAPSFFIPIHKKNSLEGTIMSVQGPIPAATLGRTLPHEHILVDFIGAAKTSYERWEVNKVVKRVFPYLIELKDQGFSTLVECTPAYLGRDPRLLLQLSKMTGLHLITNTGYYGARDFIYLPDHANYETAKQLADRWIHEFENGIEDTEIKPGFIKIGVNGKSLLPQEIKLINAAALTHQKTGLTIASHTGPALAALEQIDILVKQGVHPGAFIWVHAQSEPDLSHHVEAATQGAWISLDGVGEEKTSRYIEMLDNLKNHNLLDRTLISHDAGWYSPGEIDGGNYRGYTDIAIHLIPALINHGFSQTEIDQLCIENPARALTISIKRV